MLIGAEIIIINKNSKTDEGSTVVNNENQNKIEEIAKRSTEETNIYTILEVEDIIKNVYKYREENNKQALYNVTDASYKVNNNISVNNIEVLYSDAKEYYIQEVYNLKTDKEEIYYVYGLILKKENNDVADCYLKINKDLKNGTYSIEPLDLEEYKKAKNGEINQIDYIEIKQNNDNKYDYNIFSAKDISQKYITDYIFKLKYKTEEAFNLLDEEYKNKKFNSLDEFKEYIQNNMDRFDNFVLKQYGREENEKTVDYNVIDIDDYYYKITAYYGMKYKIILDNYTIETEEYVKKYNSATDNDKITTCINKFFKLIDSKEYKNAYSYLDDTFKQTNFNTVDRFETYAKQKFFNHNMVSIESAEQVGDIYSCKVKIKSGVSVSAMSKDITVIIMLKENTDFVMSFSIDK